jgi:hypothetical protein
MMITKLFLKALKESGVELKENLTEETIESKVLKSDEELKHEVLNVTECYLKVMADNYSRLELKHGITANKVIEQILKTKEEPEEKIKEFIESATCEKEGGKISMIDLLYNYHTWSKTKMTRNIFLKEVKKKYNVKCVKLNDRQLSCITNREWVPDFE